MKLCRPEPILVERPDGTCYRIDPPTRGQVRAALALDPVEGDEPETLQETDTRVAAQLRALIRPSGQRVDPHTGEAIEHAPRLGLEELTAAEERELLAAIMAQHHGHDPAAAVSLQRLLKKKVAMAGSSASPASTATA